MTKLITAATLFLASTYTLAAPKSETEIWNCKYVAGQDAEVEVMFSTKSIGLFIELTQGTPERPATLLFEAEQGRMLRPSDITESNRQGFKVKFKDSNNKDATLAVVEGKGTLSHIGSNAKWSYDCKSTL